MNKKDCNNMYMYSVPGRAKVQNCIGQKRLRCFKAARARDERFTQRQRFAAVLACRNDFYVAANRRVLAHLCKIIEACKCKQRFSVRCLYALRSAQNFRQEEVRVHQTAVPR